MWLNVIYTKLILCHCIQQSLQYVGWLQGLALPCACMWALVAIRFAVVCCDDLCGSLLWPTLSAVCLLSWALWITALVTYLVNYFADSTPSPKLSKFLHWSSFSVTVLDGDQLQGWFLVTRLPWNLVAVPDICARAPPIFDGTSSQAHQLAISLNCCVLLHLMIYVLCKFFLYWNKCRCHLTNFLQKPKNFKLNWKKWKVSLRQAY